MLVLTCLQQRHRLDSAARPKVDQVKAFLHQAHDFLAVGVHDFELAFRHVILLDFHKPTENLATFRIPYILLGKRFRFTGQSSFDIAGVPLQELLAGLRKHNQIVEHNCHEKINLIL